MGLLAVAPLRWMGDVQVQWLWKWGYIISAGVLAFVRDLIPSAKQKPQVSKKLSFPPNALCLPPFLIVKLKSGFIHPLPWTGFFTHCVDHTVTFRQKKNTSFGGEKWQEGELWLVLFSTEMVYSVIQCSTIFCRIPESCSLS